MIYKLKLSLFIIGFVTNALCTQRVITTRNIGCHKLINAVPDHQHSQSSNQSNLITLISGQYFCNIFNWEKEKKKKKKKRVGLGWYWKSSFTTAVVLNCDLWPVTCDLWRHAAVALVHRSDAVAATVLLVHHRVATTFSIQSHKQIISQLIQSTNN